MNIGDTCWVVEQGAIQPYAIQGIDSDHFYRLEDEQGDFYMKFAECHKDEASAILALMEKNFREITRLKNQNISLDIRLHQILSP